MRGSGYRIFVEQLAGLAADADPSVGAIAERIAAPIRVGVCGRSGVGRRTVARALDLAGITVAGPADPIDVTVYVTAEVVKPEDRAAIAAARHPVLAVLNKVDTASPLTGAARTQCAHLAQLLGVAMEPMSGLLAVAALDTSLDEPAWSALRALAARPDAVLDASVDGFLAASDPVARADRGRLLGILDVFGIALVVAAIRQGASAPGARALLRRVSGVDAVVDRLFRVGARVRYQRVRRAVAQLETLAVTDARVAEFLCRDDTVLARMAAAEDVAAADGLDGAGLAAAVGSGSVDQLARAVWWRRYSTGPVGELQRACGVDIARGALRLWSQAHKASQASGGQHRRPGH